MFGPVMKLSFGSAQFTPWNWLVAANAGRAVPTWTPEVAQQQGER